MKPMPILYIHKVGDQRFRKCIIIRSSQVKTLFIRQTGLSSKKFTDFMISYVTIQSTAQTALPVHLHLY